MPPCSLRVGTLNVNGALHHPELATIETLAHLLDAADISVLGLTDARIATTQIDSTKKLIRQLFPKGTAVIPFLALYWLLSQHYDGRPIAVILLD